LPVIPIHETIEELEAKHQLKAQKNEK